METTVFNGAEWIDLLKEIVKFLLNWIIYYLFKKMTGNSILTTCRGIAPIIVVSFILSPETKVETRMLYYTQL